jgi:hypothetical protein
MFPNDDEGFVKIRTAPTGKKTFRQSTNWDVMSDEALLYAWRVLGNHHNPVVKDVGLSLALRGFTLEGFRSRVYYSNIPALTLVKSTPPPLLDCASPSLKTWVNNRFGWVGGVLYQNFPRGLAVGFYVLFLLLALCWSNK